MYPRLPLIHVPTYGLMVALGFMLGLLLAERLARSVSIPPRKISDLGVGACLAGLVGAKLALLIVEPHLARRPWQLLFQGGVFYGGLLAAILFVLWRSPRVGLDPQEAGDVFAAPLSVGHALGRIGCFMAGCCYGRTCDLPWAVSFTNPGSMAVQNGVPPGTPLHPTQLYEVLGNLVLAGLALVLLRHRRFAGQTWWTYLAAYGAFRTIIETFRGDPRGTWFGGALSTSQVIGILATATGVTMLVIGTIRARRAPGETTP
jgi:phosphatidylglycerol:prolipoprotein diacylglycerol transferase